MVTEAPWSEPEFESEFARQLGSNWVQLLTDKWGSDWPETVTAQLVDALGADWADHPDTAAEKVAELLAETSSRPSSGDPDRQVTVDLSQNPWLRLDIESDSLRSWLVAGGVPDEWVAALAGEPLAEDGGGAASNEGDSPMDLGDYPWVSLVAEADSFQSWLVRIGVPEQDATAIADGSQ